VGVFIARYAMRPRQWHPSKRSIFRRGAGRLLSSRSLGQGPQEFLDLAAREVLSGVPRASPRYRGSFASSVCFCFSVSAWDRAGHEEDGKFQLSAVVKLQAKLSDIVKQLGPSGGMFKFLRPVDDKRIEFGQKLRAHSDIEHPNCPVPFSDWAGRLCEGFGMADWAGRLWRDLVGDLEKDMTVSEWHELWAEAHGGPPSPSLVGEPFSLDDSEGAEGGEDVNDADPPEASFQTK
jgi:hypothetical protein